MLQVLQKVNWNLLEKQTENGNAMKKIQSIFPLLSFVVIVLLFAACSQEELGTPFYAGQEVSISAALSSSNNNDGKKRISGKDNVDRIDLTWDEGDKILVTVGDKSAVFTLSSGAGTNNATFTGTMPADGASYSVQYPTFVPDLTEQRYVENGFGKDLMLMTTKEEGTIDGGFVLSADYALLGLQLTGDQQVGKIVVTNIAANKTYTLHSINVTLSAEPTLFYIVVPEGEWLQGFKVDIFANDNKTINKTLTKSGSITFSTEFATIMPTQWTTPDALDLGLSVKWATCNLGATSPEEYGDYFAWGETEPKEKYSWETYKWGSSLSKYNATDDKKILDPEDDAAHVHWGGQWRMPSVEEHNELIENCVWTCTTFNDITGYKVTAKNGNSIFLPTVGYKGSNGPSYPAGQYGLYWLRDVNESSYAYLFNIQYLGASPSITSKMGTRCYGFAIRPVCEL